MGRDFIVTRANTAEIGSKKRTISRWFSIGPKASRFIAIIVFTALGILYLTQSTQGADRSYKIRDLSEEKTQLQEEHDRLRIEESRLESLNAIDATLNSQQPTTDANKMQPASQVNYLPSER